MHVTSSTTKVPIFLAYKVLYPLIEPNHEIICQSIDQLMKSIIDDIKL